MKNGDESTTSSQKETDKYEEENHLRCTGCNTHLSILSEKCPKCERLNPKYAYR